MKIATQIFYEDQRLLACITMTPCLANQNIESRDTDKKDNSESKATQESGGKEEVELKKMRLLDNK